MTHHGMWALFYRHLHARLVRFDKRQPRSNRLKSYEAHLVFERSREVFIAAMRRGDSPAKCALLANMRFPLI